MLAADDICLRFANTVRWHASAQPEETLRGYGDLLGWVRGEGLLSEEEGGRLAALAAEDPAWAASAYGHALALREAIYRIFVAQMRGEGADAGDIALLNDEVAGALAHLRLLPASEGYAWAWDTAAPHLDSPLWPVARSAAGLLTSPELLARVGQCADDRGCGWLFLDLSKNRSRRWCDIGDCGNRAKQRRHYARSRAGW